MRSLAPLLAALLTTPAAVAQQPVTFGSLCREAVDLERLARAEPDAYRNIQWSSHDRRMLEGPDSPGWFGNADGFGGEPTPGFEKVLREPGDDGVGVYLVGEHEGPGAIVRTWSAGMGGTLRVFLDGANPPLYEGPGQAFLSRKSWLLGRAKGDWATPPGPIGAFSQEDADYLPVPFANGLRITWEGRLRDLHFYQIQIRAYRDGTTVETFRAEAPARDADDIRHAAAVFADPDRLISGGEVREERVELAPGETAVLENQRSTSRGGAIRELTFRVDAEDVDRALRGILLRIAFDGSRRYQVEAPLGDFFGTGPGIHPFESLPMRVAADGTLTCRFPMPYRRSWRIELAHVAAGGPATIDARIRTGGWAFDTAPRHFRGRWRVTRGFTSEGRGGPFDLPYVTLFGSGRLVGVACMLMNPSGVPTPGGNWWGEGDEKVFVDGEAIPSILGTGSEDYFNYSWSRPDLFAHPYCGQPLDSGPGTSGFVSNHRFQILDDLPFGRSLAFAMEVYTHGRVEGMDYGRIAWLYAAPGAFDDHEPPTPHDLELPVLPERQPVAAGGARGAEIHDAWELDPRVDGRRLETVREPLATRGKVLAWSAAVGERLALQVPFAESGDYTLHLVTVHGPDGATLRARVGSGPSSEPFDLDSPHARRLLNVAVPAEDVRRGKTEVVLECVEPGFVGIDYLWNRLETLHVPNMVEGEAMEVVAASDGVTWEDQGLRGGRWSRGRHLWVRATAVGDRIVLQAPKVGPGRYRATLVMTRSYDYGTLRVSRGDRVLAERVDTFSRQLGVANPIELGELNVEDEPLRLTFELIDSNPAADDPKTYFGIDGVILTPLDD